MKKIMIVSALAATLAGCQTPRESLVDATESCRASGLRPGTRSYSACVNGTYRENRRASQETSDAVAAGVVAGVVGGAIVAGASQPYYGGGYYRSGYYRPGYYGPGYYRY